MTGRIDTHHHVVPSFYADWLRAKGALAGGLPIPEWSPEAALALMDRHDVEVAMLSVSTPGEFLGDGADARAMARDVNDFAAQVVRDHADRFGFFATLTLPDVDGALAELDRALDTTRAAVNLARTGTLDRCPEVRFLLSHAGGFVPYAASRLATAAGDGDFLTGLARLQRYHFDIALSGTPSALPSLLAFTTPDRVTFGTDFPYAPDTAVAAMTAMYDAYELDERARLQIDRGTAEALFPRFAPAAG